MIYADTVDMYARNPQKAEWGLFDSEQNHTLIKRGLTAAEGEAHNSAIEADTERSLLQ